MNHSDIVIIGGGLAGAAAAESYRKAGGTGRVAVLSADQDLPVHRPPLSKEYLRGEEKRENVLVHPQAFYAEQDIELLAGTKVNSIDRERRELQLAGGGQFGYETLVLATGARPRRLSVPGGDLPGVYYLRSLKSSEELRDAYNNSARAVIIGAGFIGMEVAATLAQKGIACTVVEMAPRMWSRIVPPVVSNFIEAYYRDRGVDLRFGVGVRAIEGTGRAERVVLESGEELVADLVVAGVGAELNTQLADDAGLDTDRGVVVDQYLRTSDSHIYAIGDIAAFPDPIAGRIHTEHWDNALNQGRTVGKTLAGQPAAFEHIAYFFSDMFDLSLNMVGYPAGWDDIIVRGDPADGRFTAIYVREGRISAVLMLNDDEHFDTWPSLIRERLPVAEIRDILSNRSANPSDVLVGAAG